MCNLSPGGTPKFKPTTQSESNKNPGQIWELTEEYEECLTCKQVHLVNPTTGRVLGGNDDE